MTHFFKNSAVTSAEISKRGLPMANKIPSLKEKEVINMIEIQNDDYMVKIAVKYRYRNKIMRD